MKNIIIIVLLALLVFVGYHYLSQQQPTVINNNANTENVGGNTPEQNIANNSENASDLTSEETASSTDSTEQPLSYCQTLKSNIPDSENFVITTELSDGSALSSGDTISGCIYSPNDSYGNWAPFEGEIGSYEVLSSTGDVLGSGPIPVVPTDWLTLALSGDDIAYSAILDFDATGYSSGSVVMKNTNASGDPATEKTIVISVTF